MQLEDDDFPIYYVAMMHTKPCSVVFHHLFLILWSRVYRQNVFIHVYMYMYVLNSSPKGACTLSISDVCIDVPSLEHTLPAVVFTCFVTSSAFQSPV